MDNNEDYIQKNKAAWNSRTDHHIHSAFYGLDKFLEGANSLNEIELNLLGNIAGKKILHLQCHFGQDSISLGRMGASVTGVDLSDNAIGKARELAVQTGIHAEFICCDLYDLPRHLDGQFDIVFSSYGTIGWLPDLDRWASIVSHYLAPGGRFVFAEFHPIVWMFDNDFTYIAYAYSKSSPIIEKEMGTYADKTAPIETETITWNHGIGEVLTSLLNAGLRVTSFREFDYSPYNCFNQTIEFEPGKFRIASLGDKIPMVYSLTALKDA